MLSDFLDSVAVDELHPSPSLESLRPKYPMLLPFETDQPDSSSLTESIQV